MENKNAVQPVAENLETQTLQPETVVETAKEEVAQQAEEMAAEQTQQVAEQGFRPNKKQTTVAVLLVAATVLGILRYSLGHLIPYGDLRALSACVPSALYLVAWLMLSFMAVNKAVKVGAFIGTGLQLLRLIYSAISVLGTNGYVSLVLETLNYLGICYCISLILNNGGVQGRAKTWSNLLTLYYVFDFSVFFYLICFLQGWLYKYDYLYDSIIAHVFAYSSYYKLWLLILKVLITFAYWHFARSEAFSSKYDAEAVPNFSPLNKWMAMAVIVPVVIVVALIVIHNNCTWFI